MKFKIQTLLLMALLGCAPGMGARQISADAALAAALKGSGTHAPALQPRAYELAETFTAEGLNTMYAFNATDGGFLLLAADDAAMPVLGYSDEGAIDPQNMPEALRAWIEGTSGDIARASAAGASIRAAAPVADSRDIAPLVTTRWNQNAPFNDQCPTIGTQRAVTGCVATAIAQVINYHRWPATTGAGSVSYRNNSLVLSFNFARESFDWDNMLDVYTSSATQVQRNAVAKLMKACGYAAQMNYGADASGASNYYIAPALVENFTYDKAMRVCERKYYTSSEWSQLLYDELAASRPVFFTGQNSQVGHAFVLDGYNSADGFFHVNWGWGGISDGFYAVSVLNPDNQGIGGSTAGYAQNQQAFIGLRRPVAGSEYYPQFVVAAGFGTKEASYTRTEYVDILTGDGGIFSDALVALTVDMGVCLTDAQGTKQYVWWPVDAMEVDRGEGFNTYPIAATDFPASGTYRMTPVVRCGSRIVDVPVENGYPAYCTVTCTANRLTFTSPETKYDLQLVEIIPDGGLYQGHTGTFTARIKNTGNADYYNKSIAAGFFYNNDNNVVSFSALADIPAGETADIQLTGSIPADAPLGQHDLIMQYRQGANAVNMDTKGARIEILAAPAGDPVLQLTSVTLPDADSGTGSSLRPFILPNTGIIDAEIKVNCISGLFDGYICALLSDRTNTQYGWTYQSSGLLEPGADHSYKFALTLDREVALNTQYYLTFFPGILTGSSMSPESFSNASSYAVSFVDVSGIGEAVATADEVRVWPVPAQDEVNVSAPAPIVAVEVYSTSGTQVARIASDGTDNIVTVDIASLAPGLYPARVTTADGTHTVKIIKK